MRHRVASRTGAVARYWRRYNGRELAAGKGFLFADIGEVIPKGFEEPVRRYEVRWREES